MSNHTANTSLHYFVKYVCSKNCHVQEVNKVNCHVSIGADSTGATGNFAPVLTQEPGQTLRFATVPFMAVL